MQEKLGITCTHLPRQFKKQKFKVKHFPENLSEKLTSDGIVYFEKILNTILNKSHGGQVITLPCQDTAQVSFSLLSEILLCVRKGKVLFHFIMFSTPLFGNT